MRPEDVRQAYEERENEVNARLQDFDRLRDSSDERLFKELVFVILTSQSSAKSSWEATEKLESRDLLLDGDEEQVADVLAENDVAYEDRKASFIVENRKKLSQPTLVNPGTGLKLRDKIRPDDIDSTRDWLVDNLSGVGYKAASHFLRNIGYGDNVAIVSKHIIVKLNELGVVDSAEPPKNRAEYLRLERKLREFSKDIGVPLKELDLVLWSMETGEVFR